MSSTLFDRLPQAGLLLSPHEAGSTIAAVNAAARRQTELSRTPSTHWVGGDLYAVFPWMAEADIAAHALACLHTQAASLTYACSVAHDATATGYVDVTLTPLDDEVLLTLSAVQSAPLSSQLTDRLNATLDSIPDAVVLTGPDRRITRINPAFEALFGYSFAEVMGHTTEMLYESPDAYRQTGRERFNLSAEDKRKPYTIRYRRKDGSLFMSETVGTPIQSANGDVLGFLGLIRDITQRQADEQALRDSQRFVERVAQALPDILYVFDLQKQRNVYANRELSTVLGYSAEDVQAMGDQFLPQLLHPDDSAAVFAHFGRMQQAGAGDVLEVTYRMRHRAGDWRWLYSRETPLTFTSQGSVSQFVGIAQDITAQRAATESLKASEERLELALYGGDLGLWDWSVGTSKVIFNDRWAQMLGYTLDELAPDFSTWEHLVHPADLPPTVARLEAHLAGHTSIFESELRMRHKAGHWIWIMTRGRVIDRNADDEPVRVAGTHLDITARREAADALKVSEERLEVAVYGGGLGLWDWTVASGEAVFNERWADMLGYTLDELEPSFSTWDQLIHPDDRDPALHWLNAHLESQSPIYEAEVRMRHKAGHWVWILTRGRVIDRNAQGEPVRVAGTHLDITARREAEARLHEYAQALEKSNVELEQFAYLASHDLQEPLRTMRSFLGLLQRDIGDSLQGNQHQYMRFITDAAERMQALIAALLELSRVGRRDLDLQAVNLGALTEQILESLQASLHEHRGSVTHSNLPTVTADPTLIGLVLQNLISNGLKFSANAPAEVYLSAIKRGKMWQINVQDNGIGIAPEFHARVFEIFKRLHHRTEYKGTGIGLAICKKIVERHGGTIWIDSDQGQGATFLFTVPAA
ncbi:MAG: PAS domain-containing protein [Bacteroidota bacterium]